MPRQWSTRRQDGTNAYLALGERTEQLPLNASRTRSVGGEVAGVDKASNPILLT